jgi:hypothetical protein
MAEQPIIYQTPEINAETGENVKKLIDFENKAYGIRMQGYPKGLSEALINLGYLPGSKDVPGHLDNLASALKSEGPVLLRQNIRGEKVPARWYEYMEDRGDIVSGVIGDYFAGPLLDIVNGFLIGYNRDNKREAAEFLEKVKNAYPIEQFETEYIDHIFKHRKKGVPENEPLPEDQTPMPETTFYKFDDEGNEKKYCRMRGNYAMPEWFREPSGIFDSENGIYRTGALVREVERDFDPNVNDHNDE